MPGLPERGPFPIRLQTSADLAAMAWGMAAWEDPYAALPLAPFWASAGVIEGRVTHDLPPLVRLAAEGGAAIAGLRLADDALMLRIERPGVSVPVRLPAGTVFPEDGGLRLVVERDVARIEAVWAGLPVPRPGRARRRARGTTATANSCWRWRARRKGSPGWNTRRGSSSRNWSKRNTIPAAGWTAASSAGYRGQGPS
ncbi:MAG: hypothetical protein F4027_17665 [Rhodospirillaceae bacterium]|nr:hypothetical protein [Rhodospirillaceae bacterium]